MGLHTDRLFKLFPLVGTLLVPHKEASSEWLATHHGFFNKIVYDADRPKLEQSLKSKISLIPPVEREALSEGIATFAKKLFPRQNVNLDQLEKIIPDILLILLSAQPQIDIKPNSIEDTAQQCLNLIYIACESYRVCAQHQGFFTRYNESDFFFIEQQAPGLLSRAEVTKDIIDEIKKEISNKKTTNQKITPSEMELVLSQHFKFPEGINPPKDRGPLHPISRFLRQNAVFAQAFPRTVALAWSLEKLKNLEETSKRFFFRNLSNLKPEIDADAILQIIDKYSLRKAKIGGSDNKEILILQCNRFVNIDRFIKEGPPIPEKYCHAYFLKLFLEQDPLKNHLSINFIENTIVFEKYLNIDANFRLFETKARNLKYLQNPALKEQMIARLSTKETHFIEQIRFNFLFMLSKTAILSDYIFDLALVIAQRYQLNEFFSQQNLTETQLVDLCYNILHVASQVNTDAKEEKYKPAMMQIAMQLPGGYNHFKINPQNLEEALYLIKNRGTKSEDELIKELKTVGTNNYQRPKILNPEPSKENTTTSSIATVPEIQQHNAQPQSFTTSSASASVVINPTIATTSVAAPAIVQTTKQQTFSQETAAQLTTAGMDIQNSFSVISTLQTKHEVLLKALSDWESRAQQDATEKSELEEIAQEPEVKAYYQMLKAILAQSFLAATVIASGKIDGNTGVGIKAISGLSTLSSAASSASVAVFPLAAPILGFFKVVSSTVSSTLTYREMQQHVKWVEFEEIPQFAATLARRLALAQKRSIAAGISRADESIWSKIKNECGLFIEQLKSGTTFSSGEKRALLDAQLLFEYILNHEKPVDATLSERINILLQHLVGAQAALTSSVSSNNNNAVIVTATQNSQPDVALLLQEIAALKAARETDQLDQQEQARRLQELHDKIRTLQEQQTPKIASNHVDVGNGQMQLKMQTQDSASASSSASGATLMDAYKRLATNEEAVAELGRQLAMMQEELVALGKSKSGNAAVSSDDEDEAGVCFTM